ncbi:MAG: ATP-dependent zinc protease [Oceanospirillaceae bacterium]|nr:ATP-dependent zinc protease [Oceanospirillaceae bacterium]
MLETIGWREWMSLPELGIDRIKVKVDTGARTSCLHAFRVEPFRDKGALWVAADVHPVQNDQDKVISFVAPVLDERQVSDSGGHREQRFVIDTLARLGDHEWRIEMTLTNRDSMKFRMLLGRTAMYGRFNVDPAASYVQGGRP